VDRDDNVHMGGRTVLVGRDSELSELASAIESAATGSPSAVLIHGEAGVGKTRLVTEAMARGELRGARALWGRCLRFGTAESSFQPVGQLLTQWFRQAGEGERSKVLRDLPTAKLATVAPIIAEPTEGDEGRLIPLLATVLERICEQAPTVLVIDDLQWADTTSLDLLAYLVAGFGPGQHVGLFATYRDTELHEGHRLRGWLADVRRQPGVGEVQVEPLGLQETEELVAHLCGDEDAVSRGGAVFERSRGNPYFTELLALAPGPDLTADGGIRDALLASWHRLDAPAREVAQLLAVGGRPVDRSVLEQLVVAHQGSRDVFRSCVQELVSGGIGSVNAAGEVWFHHPLLSEVLLTTLSPGELRDIHGEYARMWVDADDAPPAARAAHLALHHDGAHHHNAAFEWSLRAAEAAAALFAWSEEFEHLQRACRLWPRVSPARRGIDGDRFRLVGRASDSAVRAGRFLLALELREEALRLVDRLTQPLDAARLHIHLATLQALADDDRFAWVEPEMLTLTEAAPDSPERAIALAKLAITEIKGGRYRAAANRAAESVRVARRSGSEEALAWALGYRSQLEYETSEGLEDAEEAVVHARASGDRLLLTIATGCLVNCLGSLGQRSRAAERSLDIVRDLMATGSIYETIPVLPAVAQYLLDIGRWAEARDLLREALGHRIPSSRGADLRRVAADLAARAGDLSAASQHLTRARELSPQRRLVFDPFVSAETRVALAMGDQVYALSLMAEAMPPCGRWTTTARTSCSCGRRGPLQTSPPNRASRTRLSRGSTSSWDFVRTHRSQRERRTT
jgi:tetratricopeptide (TPR) repeat protein